MNSLYITIHFAIIDQEKRRIRQLDEKSDYSLWRIRIISAISAKKLNYTMADMAADTDQETYRDQQQLATDIIVATLSDQALRVLRMVIY